MPRQHAGASTAASTQDALSAGAVTATVHVAVIARRASRTLPACLAALRDAGCPSPSVVAVGPDGPAQARNAALAGCRAPVLMLVEDDVAVSPGALRAVALAWADPRTAVAGGPLAGGPLEVDGPSPTYPGANVAFRAAALRGAGGFWPARGDPDQRDWFSEEHEAQRELARMGWGAAWVPEMAARRLGGPLPLRQRLRTGARRQAVGEPRAPREAAQAVLTGLGGALLGRRRERLGRAAENLGVLAGPRLVRAELEPVAAATPFRASVPRPVRRRRRRRRAGASQAAPAVLVYHRIAVLDEDPMALAVSPEHWAEQLDVLRARDVVPLEALVAGDAPPGALAVTVDDGYADAALLRDAGIPVTLFVSTGHVEEGRPFWWDQVTAACRTRAGALAAAGDRAWILGPAARPHLTAWLQPRPPAEIDAALEALTTIAAPGADRPLTPGELRELARHVTIGAHSRTHRCLRDATRDEQRAEVERSRDDVARWTGAVPTAFSYPFGVPGEAWDATTRAVVRDAGFACAVQIGPGPPGDPFAVPRRCAPDAGGEAFARWLEGR
jgi:peptidoglycan/xylan/chitin deacetylase (PgdA/CDA1 family)